MQPTECPLDWKNKRKPFKALSQDGWSGLI
jgi:hypothetical protein